MLKLRPFQEEIINDTREAMRYHRNILVQAPTGAGKTVMATFMADRALKRGKRVFFICHRQELILQTSKTFSKNNLPYSYIAAGQHYNPAAPIQICSIDTLKNRYDRLPHPDLAIWDEAHHLGAAGWSRVHGAYNLSYHVGLSATPQRLDGKGLGEWFDQLIVRVSTADLIEQGYLSKYKLFAPSAPDRAAMHARMGEFRTDEMMAQMATADVTGDIVEHYRKYAMGAKAIMFAINKAHSKMLVETFNSAGIPAAHLDSDTPKAERRQICYDYARGVYWVLSNVALFGEGFDLAAQTDLDVTIEAMICARPTMSLSWWLQMCGRALRKKDYPAIILDHAGNAMEHGLPCEEREWSLEGRKKGKRDTDTETTIRQCPECFFVHSRDDLKCPQCGYTYPVKERTITYEDGELIEMDPAQMRKLRAHEQASADSLDKLIELGRRRKYKNPAKWAAHVWTARQAKRRA